MIIEVTGFHTLWKFVLNDLVHFKVWYKHQWSSKLNRGCFKDAQKDWWKFLKINAPYWRSTHGAEHIPPCASNMTFVILVLLKWKCNYLQQSGTIRLFAWSKTCHSKKWNIFRDKLQETDLLSPYFVQPLIILGIWSIWNIKYQPSGAGGTCLLPAMPHCLEHRTAYKIENGDQGVPKCPMGSGKGFLGTNFCNIVFLFAHSFYENSKWGPWGP